MAEPPPAKRVKRESSSAMWDKHDNARGATTTSSPRLHDSSSSVNGTHNKRDDDRRRRSRSPRDRERERDRDKYDRGNRHERSRSRDKGSSYRDRDRDRDRHRDRGGGRDRERERSRSRDRDRHNNKRQRSRSPLRNGTATRQRSPPPAPTKDSRPTDHDRTAPVKNEPRNARPIKQEPRSAGSKLKGEGIGQDGMDVDVDDEDALLRKVMGFASFKTTQNTKVPGNQIYGVRKEKKTEYRQYMNRVGGFNRPLSPGR